MELLKVWDSTVITKKDTQENKFSHQSDVNLDGRQTHAVMYLFYMSGANFEVFRNIPPKAIRVSVV